MNKTNRTPLDELCDLTKTLKPNMSPHQLKKISLEICRAAERLGGFRAPVRWLPADVVCHVIKKEFIWNHAAISEVGSKFAPEVLNAADEWLLKNETSLTQNLIDHGWQYMQLVMSNEERGKLKRALAASAKKEQREMAKMRPKETSNGEDDEFEST